MKMMKRSRLKRPRLLCAGGLEEVDQSPEKLPTICCLIHQISSWPSSTHEDDDLIALVITMMTMTIMLTWQWWWRRTMIWKMWWSSVLPSGPLFPPNPPKPSCPTGTYGQNKFNTLSQLFFWSHTFYLLVDTRNLQKWYSFLPIPHIS